MMIRVIEQTTKEREEETLNFYAKIKPLMEGGLSLRQSVTKITGKTGGFSSKRWYLDLKDLARKDGFKKI